LKRFHALTAKGKKEKLLHQLPPNGKKKPGKKEDFGVKGWIQKELLGYASQSRPEKKIKRLNRF